MPTPPSPVPPDAVEVDARRASGLPAAGVSLRPLVGSLLLSLGVLAAIGYWTFDPTAFGAFARDLNLGLLVAAGGTVAGRVVFGAWRLRHFSGGRIGWADGIRDQIVWDFFAYVTPSTVGGGPFAIAFIARDRQLPTGEATSVVLLAMLVDQVWFALTIPVLLLATLWLDVFPDALGRAGAGALTLFFAGYLIWVLALAYGTLLRPDRLAHAVGWVFRLRLLRRFQEQAARAMDEMQGRSRALRSERVGFFVSGFAITLVPWVCRYLLAVFVLWSVVPDLDALLAFVRSAAMQLGALAVPTPGGAGGVEALYLLFLGPPLQPQALVAPTLVVWRVLSYYVFLAAGSVLVAQARVRPLDRGTGAPSAGSLSADDAAPDAEGPPPDATAAPASWRAPPPPG